MSKKFQVCIITEENVTNKYMTAGYRITPQDLIRVKENWQKVSEMNTVFMGYHQEGKRHIHLPLGRIAKYTGGTNTAGTIMTDAIMQQHACRQVFISSGAFCQMLRKFGIGMFRILPPNSD